MRFFRDTTSFLMVGAMCSLLAASCFGARINLDPPGEREFVRDLAGMLDPGSREQIRGICDQLLRDKATPILVVTIESMAKHGADDMRIETFATLLFDQWGIGHASLNNQTWNTGILLLVSKEDRKARIELGGGWGRREDALCQQIMDGQIIPRFKNGQFAAGIVAGVEALDKMGRNLEMPAAPQSLRNYTQMPRPLWHYTTALAVIGLAIFTGVSLFRRGSSGWAWLFWGVVFSVLAAILYHLLNNSGRHGGGSYGGGSYDGGSFGGGSFGGGFSGGGGSTGSW